MTSTTLSAIPVKKSNLRANSALGPGENPPARSYPSRKAQGNDLHQHLTLAASFLLPGASPWVLNMKPLRVFL